MKYVAAVLLFVVFFSGCAVHLDDASREDLRQAEKEIRILNERLLGAQEDLRSLTRALERIGSELEKLTKLIPAEDP